MGFSWIGWVDLTEEAYKTELEARKAKRQRPTATAAAGQQQQ
jgi:hypothetical protein